MNQFLKIFIIPMLVELATSSIAGLSYRDSIDLASKNVRYPRGEDPCNPLYWYPRHVPADCNASSPLPPSPSLPVPPPGPALPPAPLPMPMPMPMPAMIQPYAPLPSPMYPVPAMYPAPPMYPSPPMYPHIMPAPLPQAGFLPGIEGLVSPGGGINILPFSDVYADMLENHKQKMIRIRLQKLLDKYDNYPRKYIRRRKFGLKYGYDSDY